MANSDIWRLAFSDGTPRQALKVGLIVGTILVLINQGDQIYAGEVPVLWKVALTYLVPYCVATYGAITAKRRFLAVLKDRDKA